MPFENDSIMATEHGYNRRGEFLCEVPPHGVLLSEGVVTPIFRGDSPMLTRNMIVTFLVGAGGLYYGIQEWRLSRVVQDKPHEMTLAELIDKGPGENHHVMLSEFNAGKQMEHVYQKYETTWIPMTTPNQLGPVRAFVRADKIYSDTDMNQFRRQGQVEGVVVNLIESVNGRQRQLLEEAYPGTDIEKSIIIDIDRHKKLGSKMLLAFSVGSVSMFLFVFLLLSKLRKG
jgi:hypothetical protein